MKVLYCGWSSNIKILNISFLKASVYMPNFYYCDLFKCIMLRHIYRDIIAKIKIKVIYSTLITKTAI